MGLGLSTTTPWRLPLAPSLNWSSHPPHPLVFSVTLSFLLLGWTPNRLKWQCLFFAFSFVVYFVHFCGQLMVSAMARLGPSKRLNMDFSCPPSWVHAYLFQSCPTLCDPTDCSPPASSVHGLLQARILQWGSSKPRDGTSVFTTPAFAGGFFTAEPHEAQPSLMTQNKSNAIFNIRNSSGSSVLPYFSLFTMVTPWKYMACHTIFSE